MRGDKEPFFYDFYVELVKDLVYSRKFMATSNGMERCCS